MLFLHVGLHKTGTTYFQQAIFPHWKDVNFIRNLRVESFLKADPDKINLVSREGLTAGVVANISEKLLYLDRLHSMFPDASILISFRDHGSYVNAIYNQYLRYGGTLKFPEFFDLENDTGFIKKEDIVFTSYVNRIMELWDRRLFVFSLDELKQNKQLLFDEMGTFLGVNSDGLHPNISSAKKNVSLGRRQAEVLRAVNQLAGVKLHRDGSTRPYRALRRFGIDPPNLCQRWASWRPGDPIIGADNIGSINAHFSADWEYIKSCIASRINGRHASPSPPCPTEK